MTLKRKETSTAPEPTSQPETWGGPWGRVNHASETCEVVRFCQGSSGSRQRTHSYPYRVICAWRWHHAGELEELQIEAGADLITVRGKGLDRIVDALDVGALEVLSEIPGEMPAESDETIWVSRIAVQPRPKF